MATTGGSERERFQRLEALFDEVLDLAAAQRAARLALLAASEPGLHRELERLLAAHATASAVLGNVVGEAARAAADEATPDARPGERLGPWLIEREIGRGGMGAVFLARRADAEYEAQVALKVVGGIRTAEHLRRFRAERQILAELDHPGIARLIDGGTTAHGVPWVAMEYVDGIPLDRHCALHACSLRERLALFLQVCDAVRVAHRHLVVHRDIKPANILVTADGRVKLLDFGIAKLIAPGDADDADETRPAVRLLTPAYASPEQLRGGRITVATDVYGLGVVLYELLAGALPLATAGRSMGEVERLVCEVDPPHPSAVAPAGVARALRGDLDTIVLTALRKDPQRRYESVDRFAEDIRRYLDGYPVRARPDSRWYRFSRFVRRNEAAVATGAGVILLLAGVAIAMTVQARRLAVQRDAASVAQAKAEQVASFLASVFEVADPSEARGREVTARELLDEGARRIETELADHPDVQATMMRTIGDVYSSLGLQSTARSMMERALEIHRRVLPPGHPEIATSELALGTVLHDEGRMVEADSLERSSLATRRALYGDDDLAVAEVLGQLAYTVENLGRLAEAESLFRRALTIERARRDPGDPLVAAAMTRLSRLLRRLEARDEAETLLREALAIELRAFGEVHVATTSTMRNLASVLRDLGKPVEAESLYLRTLAARRRLYGDGHPEVANTLNSYGLLLLDLDRPQEAVGAFREYASVLERLYGGAHLSVAAAQNNLAIAYRDLGRLDDAAAAYERSIAIGDVALAPRHVNKAIPRLGLASIEMARGRHARAEALLRESLALRRAGLPSGHRYIGESLSELGWCVAQRGKRAEARVLLTEAVAVLEKAEGDSARRTVIARRRLASLSE